MTTNEFSCTTVSPPFQNTVYHWHLRSLKAFIAAVFDTFQYHVYSKTSELTCKHINCPERICDLWLTLSRGRFTEMRDENNCFNSIRLNFSSVSCRKTKTPLLQRSVWFHVYVHESEKEKTWTRIVTQHPLNHIKMHFCSHMYSLCSIHASSVPEVSL